MPLCFTYHILLFVQSAVYIAYISNKRVRMAHNSLNCFKGPTYVVHRSLRGGTFEPIFLTFLMLDKSGEKNGMTMILIVTTTVAMQFILCKFGEIYSKTKASSGKKMQFWLKGPTSPLRYRIGYSKMLLSPRNQSENFAAFTSHDVCLT